MPNILINIHEYFTNNFLDVIGFALTVVGGCFALLQWRESIKNNRAQYVKELLFSVMNDEKITKFLNITDYRLRQRLVQK